MVAERLRTGVAAAFATAAVPLAASVGGAVRSGPRIDGEELRSDADRALYEAKRHGGAAVRFRAPLAAVSERPGVRRGCKDSVHG